MERTTERQLEQLVKMITEEFRWANLLPAETKVAKHMDGHTVSIQQATKVTRDTRTSHYISAMGTWV